MRLPLLLLCLMAWCGNIWGQGDFSLTVRTPKSMGKSVTLTVYDSDSNWHRQTKRVKNGECMFSGHLKKTCAAELSFAGNRNMYLFLEATEMNVEVNGDDLEHSPVTGSRTNSQYRYALETTTDGKALAAYIQENRKSPIAAFLLFRQMRNMETTEVEKLYRTLDSAEASCYHYSAVKKHLAESIALAIGNPLPDFEFIADGEALRFSECLRKDTMTVIFFGASWCDICKRDIAVAKQVCDDSITCIYIDMADDHRGWDAPWISKLDITHLPYIIMLDRKGRIIARDVRIWELERLTKD